MSDGYQKFFKQAREASAQTPRKISSPAGKSTRPRSQGASQNRFALAQDQNKVAKSRRHAGRSISRENLQPKLSAQSPEDTLREALATRFASRKQLAEARHRKMTKFPYASAAVVVLGLLAAGFAYQYPDVVEKLSSKLEVGAFGQAEASDVATSEKESKKGTAKAAGRQSSSTEKSAERGPAGAVNGDEAPVNIKGWSPEELSFFNKLNDRKKELDQREAELGKLEEELHQQQIALDEKIKQLEKMRSEISTTLKTRVTTDQAKVDKLVDFYSSMKAQNAAKVIESLNEDLAIAVLDKMKKKNAAEILNMMDAKKARHLSELLTGYERAPASSEDSGA